MKNMVHLVVVVTRGSITSCADGPCSLLGGDGGSVKMEA